MSESDMRGKVLRILKPLHGIAVENPVLPGTSDVNYIDGWIELKWLRSWPKRPGTPVAIEHYTPQQKLFIRKRHSLGGRAFLLLQCRREWLMFKHPVTMDVGKLTKQELIDSSFAYWKNGLNNLEFIKCLKN